MTTATAGTAAESALTDAFAQLAPASASASATAGTAPAATGPAEQPSGVEAEAALLAAFSGVPALSRAVVRPTAGGGVTITATLQQRNLPANAQRRYNITAVLPQLPATGVAAAPAAALVGLPQELHADVQVVSVAPSGRQQLVVLKGPNEGASVLLQVWRGARMLTELAVPKALHGPLVNDGYFASGAAWAADESAVVYTAETPAPERTPAWCGPESLKDRAAPRSWRGVGAAAEDWGELNTGKRPPAPFVLDVARCEVLQVPGLPEEHSVGCPTWCPPQPPATHTTHGSVPPAADDQAAAAGPSTSSSSSTGGGPSGGPSGLVLVAWPHAAPPSFSRMAAACGPRKLGVVFCYNRSAHLYHVALRRGADGSLQFGPSATRLCPSMDSGLSPTFTPAGDALVFVSHQEAVDTGTHAATGRLYRLDWSPQAGAAVASEPRLLVDVVDRPAGPTAFPGLYTAAIPEDGFVGPNTLLLNTQWGAASAIAALDTAADAAAAPVPLTPVDCAAAGAASWSLLGVAGGLAVASRAAPDSPPALYVARLPEDPSSLTAAGAAPLSWRPLALGAPDGIDTASDLPPAVQQALANLEYRVMRVAPRVGDRRDTFDCVVWAPRDRSGPLPAVLLPHGGPHTAVTLSWFPAYAFLAALGHVLLAPNYRGSTGYGQTALASLPGAIGRQDVDDCMAALGAAVAEGLVDASRVSVVGGSHGGFLAGHLLGQHPATFRAGVMRNPVTNISAMIAASDIPDWCYVETMGSEEGRRRCCPAPTPADLAVMFAASPAAYVDRVAAPLLMMLGARDRRVPPPDGLQFLSALRGRDVAAAGPPPPTRLIVFPEDSHGLDKPQTEYEQWINAAWWLKMYAGPPQEAAAEQAGGA